MALINPEIVITRVVVEWLQKYYPLSEYKLIIKKAQSWLKKAMGQKGVKESSLNLIEII